MRIDPTELACAPLASGVPTVSALDSWTGGLHEGKVSGPPCVLFGAVQWAWPRVVQYLIAHGAKMDIKDDAGLSPLDAASGKGTDNRPSAEVAKILQASIGK